MSLELHVCASAYLAERYAELLGFNMSLISAAGVTSQEDFKHFSISVKKTFCFFFFLILRRIKQSVS